MLKEIIEQKNTIATAINQDESQIMKVAQEINNAKGIFFIGCGTAARVAPRLFCTIFSGFQKNWALMLFPTPTTQASSLKTRFKTSSIELTGVGVTPLKAIWLPCPAGEI